MKITDAQIHAWYPNTPQRPWVEGASPPHGPQFTIDQVLATMDEGGVERCIIVPVTCTGFDNDFALEGARAHPDLMLMRPMHPSVWPPGVSKRACWVCVSSSWASPGRLC